MVIINYIDYLKIFDAVLKLLLVIKVTTKITAQNIVF